MLYGTINIAITIIPSYIKVLNNAQIDDIILYARDRLIHLYANLGAHWRQDFAVIIWKLLV